jgi:negative regulator of flagellin synthesis FlgM
MKVNGSGPGSIDTARTISGAGSAQTVTQSKERKDRSGMANIDSGVSDKVAISGRAKEAARVKELATSASDVDEARIAKLRAAIEGGSYKMNAEAIADKLVDEHLFNTI